MATRGAPPASLPSKVTSVPPNQTLYVVNLPLKINKPALRVELYMLFSTYGAILDVVALKTREMRGSAHIVYKDVQTATLAMRALDGFELHGRKLKITYGKGRSNIISKLEGTFKPLTTAASGNVEVTDLQQSIFNAPVPGAPPPATGLPSKPPGPESDNRGVKRTRDEEDEESEDSDVAMEEDSDEE
ncbi:U2 small nuclear ribonucleoprotein B' [Naviculisporaceae sp. PSN 640]